MPNADYSYSGFNPGAGLSDFAQTMHQGWQDQLALRQMQQQQQQQQYQNLLSTEQHEAQYGPVTGEQAVPEEIIGAPPNLSQVANQAQQQAQGNKSKSFVYANGQFQSPNAAPSSGQSVPAQAPQGSTAQPAGPLTPQDEAIGKQEGVQNAPTKGVQSGPQGDGSYVTPEGHVIDAEKVARLKSLGGHITDDGQMLLPNHIANRLLDRDIADRKTQAMIQENAMRWTRPDQIRTAPAPRAAPDTTGKLSVQDKQDEDIYNKAQAFKASQNYFSATPQERVQANQIISNYEQAHFQKGAASPAPKAPPAPSASAGHSQQSIESGIQKYMDKFHVNRQEAAKAIQAAAGQ